ncbi:MAG: metallophosphoesterase [Candidatus Omnitrophica bacterium]|nr:metallophosphoesterase [Candidatus Omnitrophota bacterium]
MKKIIVLKVMLVCGLATIGFADLKQGDALYKGEKWSEARKEYETLLPELKGQQKAEVLYKIGYTYEREGRRFDEAIETYKKAIAVEEADDIIKAKAHLRIGYLLRYLRKFQEAIDELSKIEKLKHVPAEILGEALLYKAWSYNSLNQEEKAIELFREIGDNQNIPAVNRATAILNIAGKFREQKKYEEAINEYQKIIDIKGPIRAQKEEASNYITECRNLLEGSKPFYIMPYVTRVDKNSAEIYWVSQLTDEKGKIIVKDREQKIEKVPQVIPIKSTECFLSYAKIENLKPDTKYQYEVIYEKTKAEGSFKTSSESGTKVIFCLITDTQLNMDTHKKMAQLISKEDPDFVLHTGDLTDKGSSWPRWKAELFDPGYDYFKKTAFYPVIGNHDGGHFFPILFGMKKGKNYYSVTYGNTQLIVIDSYWSGGPGSRGRQEQLEWLEQTLSQSNATWKIVGVHLPMISVKTGEKWFGEQDFLPILEKYGVDIVLAGHVAYYVRTVPVGSKGVKPIIHVINSGPGPAGVPPPSPFNAAGSGSKQFLVFRIDGQKLEMLCKDASGNTLDKMVIVKQDGTYQKEVMEKAVDIELFRKISNIYYELLTPENYNLVVNPVSIPQPGKKVVFSIDLNRLPRGGLKKESLPQGLKLIIEQTPGNLWKIRRQEFSLDKDKINFEATVPENFTMGTGIFKPNLEVSINLMLDGRMFEPFITKVIFNQELYQKMSQFGKTMLPLIWNFKLDPEEKGEKQQWYLDKGKNGWQTISILKNWEEQLGEDYDGWGWYKTSVLIPALKKNCRLWLEFGSIDESCWVYVNGKLAGKQIFDSKIDEDAWWKPRRFDITDMAYQKRKNLLVVKVQDTFGLGGIKSAVLYQEPGNLLAQGDFANETSRWKVVSGNEKYPVDEYSKKTDGSLEISFDKGMYVDERSIRIKKTKEEPVILTTEINGLKNGKYVFTLRWKQCFRENIKIRNKAISIYIAPENLEKLVYEEPKVFLLAVAYPSSGSDRWQENFLEFSVPVSLAGKKLCLNIFFYEPATYYIDEVSIKRFN